MANGSRQLTDSGFYHVVTRGNGRQMIFEDDQDRRVFTAMLARTMANREVAILAWCLMDNHVHLLLRDEQQHLSAAMQRLLTGYARYYNARTSHVGHVFQQRFHSETIEVERRLLATVRNIHINPTNAGIARADEYYWSSYREYVSEARMCETSLVLSMLDGPSGFAELCCSGADFEAGFEGSTRLTDDGARGIAEAVRGTRGLRIQRI